MKFRAVRTVYLCDKDTSTRGELLTMTKIDLHSYHVVSQ